MTFEEWWNTKDYPARCKGNCMEAFNAGLHADVHTDNSKVITELETQIEKMKCCSNCKHYAKNYELCCYSLGDEDYDCRGRKWEMKENDNTLCIRTQK
jgi:hypothetical protein